MGSCRDAEEEVVNGAAEFGSKEDMMRAEKYLFRTSMSIVRGCEKQLKESSASSNIVTWNLPCK